MRSKIDGDYYLSKDANRSPKNFEGAFDRSGKRLSRPGKDNDSIGLGGCKK